MSTRSGKRIHNEETEIPKLKKHKNYVTYPTDDEGGYVTANDLSLAKSTRKSKKNTLKELNTNVPDSDIDDTHDGKRTTRVTRQTRRFGDAEEAALNTEKKPSKLPIANGKAKSKKGKKKKSKNSDINENVNESEQEEQPKVSKKSKKKKRKGKQSAEEVKPANNASLSTDSFHSAAGSPEKMVIDETPEKNDTTLKNKETEDSLELNKTLEKQSKSKSSLKPETPQKDEVTIISKDINSTFDKNEVENNVQKDTTFEKEPKAKRSLRSSISITEIVNEKQNKIEIEPARKSLQSNNSSTENLKNSSTALNTTFEKPSDEKEIKTDSTSLDSTFDKPDQKLNSTYDKIEQKTDSQRSSLISSDNSEINLTYDKENSRISITSDESKAENIVNTTPVLIESSMDETQLSKVSEHNLSPKPNHSLQPPTTPLKREGTFTKESPEIMITDKTPTKRMTLPSPGLTPYHATGNPRNSQKEKSILNVTRSIEKPTHRVSLAEVPQRQTRVMFCSPTDNPVAAMQQKKKVIKSSMKGSNKSFVFDESASAPRSSARKRSFSHGADESRAKRKRLADDLQLSVDRLSRPRTSSASAKLPDTTPSKSPVAAKVKPDAPRTRLPNFAALHQKQFDKMESLGECQERKLRRAKKLLLPKTPNGVVTVLDRGSPRGTTEKTKQKAPVTKPETSAKKSLTFPSKVEPPRQPKQPTLESLRPGYTKFGFKMNTGINPFSVPSKNESKTKPNKEKSEISSDLTEKSTSAPKTPMLPTVKQIKATTLPSLKGGTMRKEAAKQTVMREKSFTSISDKRSVKRNECRTIIKGVRTNRRFELQMKMRNID